MDSINLDFFGPPVSSDEKKLPQAVPNETIVNRDPNKPKKQKVTSIRPETLSIKPVETQAEIDAWIAERKKRFPTRAKIAADQLAKQQREELGALDLSEPLPKKTKANRPKEKSSLKPCKAASFLDKLTEDQAREDHSRVLQCFRYFTTHNFLQD